MYFPCLFLEIEDWDFCDASEIFIGGMSLLGIDDTFVLYPGVAVLKLEALFALL